MSTEDAKKPIPWLKIIVILAIVSGVIALFRLLPVADYLQAALDWVDRLGYWGPIAFIAIYALSVVFFVPASLLTAAAGTLFGVVMGVVYVSIASTLGATLAFLVGRYLVRTWVEKKIEGNSTFSAIDSAVAQAGWKIVGLTRLSPIFPFTLLNYAYGITKVKLWHYVLASWIGMLPGTIMYVYIGSLGKAAAESNDKTPVQWAMYGIGLVATILVTVFITRIAQKAIKTNLEEK